MILFNLRCSDGHKFEAWFRNGAAWDQREAGEICCPVCASPDVAKAPMAPRIARSRSESKVESREESKGESREESKGETQPAERVHEEMARRIGSLCRKIEETCDYVGDRFAEEARRIHYGEIKSHSIYGETTTAEAEELRDEGLVFQRIPWLSRTNS